MLKENGKFSVTTPLRIESVANKREHWSVKYRRTKRDRQAMMVVIPRGLPVPCEVTITRIAPRRLDGDNLQSGCKAIRDAIAERLGVDDADPRVIWNYAQEKGKPKEYAVRIEIKPAVGLKEKQT